MTHVNLQNEKEAQLRLCLVSFFSCYWMRQTWGLCWRTKASNKSLHLYRFSYKNVSSFGPWTTLVMLTTFQQTQIIMTWFSTPVSGYIEEDSQHASVISHWIHWWWLLCLLFETIASLFVLIPPLWFPLFFLCTGICFVFPSPSFEVLRLWCNVKLFEAKWICNLQRAHK